jgi:hypothetical protein
MKSNATVQSRNGERISGGKEMAKRKVTKKEVATSQQGSLSYDECEIEIRDNPNIFENYKTNNTYRYIS